MSKLKIHLGGLAICLCGFACSQSDRMLPLSERYPRPDSEIIQRTLTPEQFKVTQRDGTEQPFHNAYWDHKEAGIYVIVYSSTILRGDIPGVENLPFWAQRKKKIEEHAHACLFILRGAVATKVANVVGENTYK